MCTHLSLYVEQIFLISYLDAETLMLFDFSQVVQFCEMFFHSSEILVIYWNNLCCFRVLCNMFVLSCGNSPEDCFVSFWGVTHVLSLILEHSMVISDSATPGLTHYAQYVVLAPAVSSFQVLCSD